MITNEVLKSFLVCEYKAYLKFHNRRGVRTEYEQLEHERSSLCTVHFHQNLKKKYSVKQLSQAVRVDKIAHIKQPTYIIEPTFQADDTKLTFDALCIAPSQHSGKVNTYLAIDTVGREEFCKYDKLQLAVKSTLIARVHDVTFDYGKIVYGQELRHTKFAVATYEQESQKILKALFKILSRAEAPCFFHNDHCKICEFGENCRTKLIEQDDLSLLGGLRHKDVLKQKNRGIFTVLQFSYTYKPRKKRKGSKKEYQYEGALKALAIREQQTYLKEIPKFLPSRISVYIDFEGIPDEKYIYLIGVLINEEGTETQISFWGDSPADEEAIFVQFFEAISHFEQFTLYHYGSYEVRMLRRFNKKLSYKYDAIVQRLLEHSVNTLSFFTSIVYPPTYTNGLKDIAQFLGFKWSRHEATGLQSIVWRRKWESSHSAKYKTEILQYNAEDCQALQMVMCWLENIEESIKKATDNQFVHVADIQSIAGRKSFNRPMNQIPEFKTVTKFAYFDYQHTKVYIRTHARLNKAVKTASKACTRPNTINKTIQFNPNKCPYCKNRKIYRSEKAHKTVLDLRFMKHGIKKWVIRFEGWRFKCTKCKRTFYHERYTSVDQCGPNLMNWCINQMISHRNTAKQVEDMLSETFTIRLSSDRIQKFKSQYAKRYTCTVDKIKDVLFEGTVLHVDETKVSIKGVPGYVWILTNFDTVLYLYRVTRETDFLKEMLQDFKGIVVSDFYPGYDELPCLQQKCLIHLIRDFNDDLFVNQLDEELKEVASNFGILLRKIVGTIDTYGLKHRHLNKHKKDVEIFYTRHIEKEYESELAVKYQKRFKRYKKSLFTFLNHDSIPWNNNNAEHAVKPFAAKRRTVNGLFTEISIADYLVLLSIQQTCEYRGIKFLDFLRSGEMSIEAYWERT